MLLRQTKYIISLARSKEIVLENLHYLPLGPGLTVQWCSEMNCHPWLPIERQSTYIRLKIFANIFCGLGFLARFDR